MSDPSNERGWTLGTLKILVDEYMRSINLQIAALEKHTTTRFEASEKAIVKAEDAQRAYNVGHNDLVRKMDDQNKATMPRNETETRFKAMEEKIALLTGSFSMGSGMQTGAKEAKDEGRAMIHILISTVSVLLAIGGVIFGFAKSMP